MREENRFIRAVMICLFLVLLVGNIASSSNGSIGCVSIQKHKMHFDVYSGQDLLVNAIVTKSDGLKKESYNVSNKNHVLIKDLSSSNEVTALISRMDIFNSIDPYEDKNSNFIYTLYYPETNENEKIPQKLHSSNPLEGRKSIFVVPHYRFERDILINRIEAAKDKDQHEMRQAEKGMNYLLRVIGLMVCQNYIKEHREESTEQIQIQFSISEQMKISETELKQMIEKSPVPCSLLKKLMVYNGLNSNTKHALGHIEKILDKTLEGKGLAILNEIQETFNSNTMILIRKLNYSENKYKDHILDKMLEIVAIDTIRAINIASNRKLYPDIIQSRGEIEEEAELKQIRLTEEEVNDRLDLLSSIDEEEPKQKTEMCNRSVLEMFIAKIKRISKSAKDIAYEEICKENRAFIEEATGKRVECYSKHVHIYTVEGIFRREIVQIKAILEARESQPYPTDTNNPKVGMANENKQIIDILSKISAEEQADSSESAQKGEKIESILSNIEKAVSVSGNEDTILEIIGEKKQSIVDVILESLPSTGNEDAICTKNQLEQAVAAIVDGIIKERIDSEHPKIFAALEKEIEKEKEILFQNSYDNLVSIRHLITKLGYKEHRIFHFLHSSHGPAFLTHYYLALLDSSESARNWLMNDMTRSQPITVDLYQILYNILEYNTTLRSHTMIWSNPAFLIINPSTNPIQTKEAYISYKSEIDGKIYRKTIDITDENVQAYIDAKTSQDIDNIEGSIKEICISCFNDNSTDFRCPHKYLLNTVE